MDYVVKRLIETTVLILSSVFAYWIRFNTFLIPEYYLIPVSIYVISASYLLVIENGTANKYAVEREVRPIRILLALVFSGIITANFLYFTKTGESFSRAWLIYAVLASYFALLVIRFLAKMLVHLETPITNIVVVGCKPIASYRKAVKDSFQLNSQMNILAAFSPLKDGVDLSMAPVLQFIETQRIKADKKEVVKQVWIADDVVAKIGGNQLAEIFSDSSIELKYLLSSPRPLMKKERLVKFNNHLLIDAAPNSNIDLDLGIKFLLDRFVAFFALIILAPMLLLIAIAIKLTSKGPILYKQLRYGTNGTEFTVFKFRTMRDDENSLEFKQAEKKDPRVTHVGSFLRRSSLDELPQLFNVLIGSMSLVGPRPHPTQLNEDYRDSITLYMQRHTVKPGITGLAQIRGFRGETIDDKSMENRISSDLEYIRNWSLSLDIKILLLTVKHIITTSRAY